MAELKTQATDSNVQAFLEGIEGEEKRADSFALLAMMQDITGQAPKMWGASIIGFGEQHYKYASGREGDWFLLGFSPRKQNLTVYITGSYWESHSEELSKLGKHKIGKGCLYIKRLKDVDQEVLAGLLRQALAEVSPPNAEGNSAE